MKKIRLHDILMAAYQATTGDALNPQKHTMSVLAQIANWIPDKIIKNLFQKHKIQTSYFNATSHVISMVYAHLAHCAVQRLRLMPLARIR